MAEQQYYELGQFFGGYFHQHWKELYDWEGKEPTFEPIVHLCIHESSGDELRKTIEQLEQLISQRLDEQELRQVVTRTLGANIYAQGMGMTYQRWLEEVLEILKTGHVPEKLLKRIVE